MKARGLALLLGIAALAGCSGQAPQPDDLPVFKSHPRYAPPPGVRSNWVPSLGVYRLLDARGTYYRERTYYRYRQGWSWALGADGPWQSTDSSGVPPGLYRYYFP